MPDEPATPPAGGQAPPANPPTDPPAPPADPPANPPTGQAPDQAKLEAELRRARDEAAASRVKLNETAAELKKMKDAQLSETERQANRIKELEAETAAAKAAAREADVKVALAAAGAKKPELLAKLIPSDATDLKKAVEDLKKENPEFFGSAGPPPRTGGADAGAGKGNNQDQGLGGMNAIIRKMAGR